MVSCWDPRKCSRSLRRPRCWPRRWLISWLLQRPRSLRSLRRPRRWPRRWLIRWLLQRPRSWLLRRPRRRPRRWLIRWLIRWLLQRPRRWPRRWLIRWLLDKAARQGPTFFRGRGGALRGALRGALLGRVCRPKRTPAAHTLAPRRLRVDVRLGDLPPQRAIAEGALDQVVTIDHAMPQ